ncbi:MAG: VanZ family protein [Burkholderiaceae bacterium]|jgi:VanZ family protein|nr:VanZ family protein [Burkholderiaceae bacterium]
MWMPKLAFWLACATVAVLSLLPADVLAGGVFDWWDKAQHALGFAGLSLLGLWAHPGRSGWVIPGLLVFGAGIEVAQAATGWRIGELPDLLADAVGIGVGWLVWTRLRRAPVRAEA